MLLEEKNKVILNATEQLIVEFIATERQRNKDRYHVSTQKQYSSLDPLELNRQGFGAEMAFCIWDNVYPDFAIHNNSGGYDAIDSQGRRVDVKCSNTNFLLAPEYKDVDECDIYVLIKGRFPTYNLVGWLYSSELINEKNLDYHFNKDKKSYAVLAEDLRPMWEHE